MTAPHTHLRDGRIRVLEGELSGVRAELTRLDAKCATLTAIAGAGLAILGGQIGKAELSMRITLALAALALAAAAVVLLVGVLRPRLGRTGFCRWSQMTVDQIQELFRTGELDSERTSITVARLQPVDLHVLSGLVARKNRRLQWAVDLLVAGVVLTGAAPLVGVIA